MSDVSVIGTGRMGSAMAGTLARAGLDVMVWNRTGDRARAVADETGAAVADSAAEAAAAAPVVISSLADDEAVMGTYEAHEGLLVGIQPRSIIVETSTIDPRTAIALAARVAERDAVFVDAPVSGSVSLVEQGALTIMVGGPAAAVRAAGEVLDALATRVFHLGDVGAGATMKLAVNAVVHALNVTLSEALVLAEAGGVERRAAYEVFAASAAGAPFVAYKRAAFEDPDDAPVAFSLDLVTKDLDLITALGERLGVPMAQARANRVVTGDAVDAGLGGRDMSALAVLLREQAERA